MSSADTRTNEQQSPGQVTPHELLYIAAPEYAEKKTPSDPCMDEIIKRLTRKRKCDDTSAQNHKSLPTDTYYQNYIQDTCDECGEKGNIYLGHAAIAFGEWHSVIGLCLKCGGQPGKFSHRHTFYSCEQTSSDSDTENCGDEVSCAEAE